MRPWPKLTCYINVLALPAVELHEYSHGPQFRYRCDRHSALHSRLHSSRSGCIRSSTNLAKGARSCGRRRKNRREADLVPGGVRLRLPARLEFRNDHRRAYQRGTRTVSNVSRVVDRRPGPRSRCAGGDCQTKPCLSSDRRDRTRRGHALLHSPVFRPRRRFPR